MKTAQKRAVADLKHCSYPWDPEARSLRIMFCLCRASSPSMLAYHIVKNRCRGCDPMPLWMIRHMSHGPILSHQDCVITVKAAVTSQTPMVAIVYGRCLAAHNCILYLDFFIFNIYSCNIIKISQSEITCQSQNVYSAECLWFSLLIGHVSNINSVAAFLELDLVTSARLPTSHAFRGLRSFSV